MNGSPQSDDPLDNVEHIRGELRSVTDEAEDTGVTNMPSTAPPRIKGFLAALFSLPPWGRTLVMALLVVGSLGLVWRFGPAIVGLFWRP